MVTVHLCLFYSHVMYTFHQICYKSYIVEAKERLSGKVLWVMEDPPLKFNLLQLPT